MDSRTAIDILRNANLGGVLREAADYAIKLLEAQEQGRLVVLPCKVGDAVYRHDEGDEGCDCDPYVDERKVIGITLTDDHEVYFFLNNGLGEHLDPFEECDIGKTVFLTREEAEAALKKEV